VKLHLCHYSRAKEGNIRQALIDRFGGQAVLKSAAPGPPYGISGDVWAALALGMTWVDLMAPERLLTPKDVAETWPSLLYEFSITPAGAGRS
jgi:hypothetical protein